MKTLIFTLLCTLIHVGTTFGKTITIDNLNIRPNSRFSYSLDKKNGTIKTQPGYTVPTTAQSGNSIVVPLRLDDLDLDGTGGHNDYIDFTLRVIPFHEQVQWSGTELKNRGTMTPGDGLTFMITCVSLSPGTKGSVCFDGFTSASIQGSNWHNGSYDVSMDINGITISGIGTTDADSPSKTYRLANNAFMNQILTCNHVAIGPSGGLISVREFDLQFTHTSQSLPVLQN